MLWEQRLWVKQISYGVNLLGNKYLGRLGCVAQSIETLHFLEAVKFARLELGGWTIWELHGTTCGSQCQVGDPFWSVRCRCSLVVVE